VDLFQLAQPNRAVCPAVVTLDVGGALRVCDAHGSKDLPPPVQEDLSHHELSGVGAPWHLTAQDLFLFNVSVLEQPLATPGLNDPVHLYGTLFGPVDGVTIPAGVRGQLTVTRADVLSGLVQGAAHPFRSRNDVRSGRCFHALLPGGNDAETASGRGLVLAYPVLPAELGADDVSNELLVSQMLHDLLGALQADLRSEGKSHPLTNTLLPCPSRAALLAELQSRGFAIKGDTAVRNRGAGGSMLTSVFGALTADKLPIPPEGTVEDFLELARASLSAFEGWPSSRAQHLARQLGLRNASPQVPRVEPGVTPVVSPYAPRTGASAAPPSVDFSTGPQGWMQDFMGPATTSKAGARVTVARPVAAPAPPPPAPQKKSGNPGWMEDFPSKPTPAAAPRPAAAPSPAPPKAPAQKAKPTSEKAPAPGKPDWLKDFE